MKTTKIISDQSKTYCKSLIDELPLDGSHTVIVKKTGSDSTAKQRHLQWKWYTEVSLSGLGMYDTKEDVHIMAKWQFARPILLRDDEVFVIVYGTFMDTISAYDAETKRRYTKTFAKDYISSERMTVKQRAEYLTDFERYWVGKGVELTDPSTMGLDLRRVK